MEHTGSTAVETALSAQVAKETEILDGVDFTTAPALKGYVRYETKPAAETILRLDRQDPLLARWQYGLGRAAVFTSDAKTRWATDWVTWKGYDKFFTNLTRDLLPHARGGEASVEYDSASVARSTSCIVSVQGRQEPARRSGDFRHREPIASGKHNRCQ